jgi:hypothetical protein
MDVASHEHPVSEQYFEKNPDLPWVYCCQVPHHEATKRSDAIITTGSRHREQKYMTQLE